MSECWAACLGDCSDKITKEHIFSKGIFPSDELFVQGFQWCPNELVKVGLSSLTAKVLCSNHNSGLSAADGAATTTVRLFQEALDLQSFRQKYKPTRWSREQFKINGYELESWFLKTLINIAYKSEKMIGKRATEPGVPSVDLVEIAFQRRRFSPPAGVYTIAGVGDTGDRDGRVRVTLPSSRPSHTAGAVFYFMGLKYLLYLDDDLQPGPEHFVKRQVGEVFVPLPPCQIQGARQALPHHRFQVVMATGRGGAQIVESLSEDPAYRSTTGCQSFFRCILSLLSPFPYLSGQLRMRFSLFLGPRWMTAELPPLLSFLGGMFLGTGKATLPAHGSKEFQRFG
jgi:hypothetical protein